MAETVQTFGEAAQPPKAKRKYGRKKGSRNAATADQLKAEIIDRLDRMITVARSGAKINWD